jgi:hypothetical protein
MLRSFLFAAALLPLCPSVLAQGPARLVTLTRMFQSLRVHDIDNCAQINQCGPIGFPNMPPAVPFAGGVAWDPTTRGAWVTNGTLLAKVDDDCDFQCPIGPASVTNAQVTGLEVVESQLRLYAIDNQGFLTQWSLRCPPTVESVCQTGLMTGTVPLVPTGIAVDEGLRLVFYSLTNPATNENLLAVASLSDPCQIMQRINLHPCPSPTLPPPRSIQGLAVDWCHRVLYATDGDRVIAFDYQLGGIGVIITGQRCCPPTAITLDDDVGIAYRPGRETPFGTNCANGLCPDCPMRHSLGNDPNVGNGLFFTRTAGVPRLSLIWNLIGVGACSNAPVLPPLCGPVYTNPLAEIYGPVFPVALGNGPCDANAFFALGIPVDPYFCGIVLSSQALALCFDLQGNFGTSLSNCVTFELQGN